MSEILSIDNFTKVIDEVKGFLAPILEKTTQEQFKTLKKYLDSKGLKQFSSDAIREALEHSLQMQLMEAAKKQYLFMEKSDHFGDAGEQRVAISFCRVLLNIPANREVTQLDANLFREELSQFDEKLGNPSAEKLKKLVKEAYVDILGKALSLDQVNTINHILEFIQSPFRYSLSLSSSGAEFIFGELEVISEAHLKYHNKSVQLQKTEIARSPLKILSMAATATPTGTIIRYASCETIFYNKWHSFYETSDFEKELLQSHDYSNIREAIKSQALKAYRFLKQDQVEAGKKLFIDEMVEGIIWHELGHLISLEDNRYLSAWVGSLGDSVSGYGNEAITVLKEALADWAPAFDGACGPIWHFIQLSKSDYQKAKRMVYVYLSDYWFLDVGEDFMGITTDVIVPLIAQFIDSKGEIDFKRMEKAHGEIFQFLVKRYIAGVTLLMDIFRKASYKISDQHVISYDVLKKQVTDMYLEDPLRKDKTADDIVGTSHFWMNMLGYLKKFSPEGYQKFKQTLHDYTASFSIEMLSKLNRQNKNYANLRAYVIEQMKSIGCYLSDKDKSPKEWIEDAAKELELPLEAAKLAAARFKALMKGETKIEVAIDYAGKPNPFIAMFQTILIKSDFGDILSGMVIGDELKPTEKLSDEKIIKFIKLIAKHLDSDDFQSISLLKINQNYLSSSTQFENSLNSLQLKNGKPLKDLIKKTNLLSFSDPHLFEIFVPIKKGFWDWNTVQAVWRINTQFRPKSNELQWTVDEAFMSYLFKSIASS